MNTDVASMGSKNPISYKPDFSYWLTVVSCHLFIASYGLAVLFRVIFLVCYTSQLTAQLRLNYVDYTTRLTGTKIDELVEVSQDREAWRELVVACVDLYNQPIERKIDR